MCKKQFTKRNERWDIKEFIDGQRELSVQYKNGKRDGLCISYFENGQIKGKAQWKDGGPDVEWLRYYENGQIRLIEQYKDGKHYKILYQN